MAQRFCKDCAHSRDTGRGTPENLVCESPRNYIEHIDRAKYLVTGIEQKPRRAMRGGDCETLRTPRAPGVAELVCGPEAKWYEPKPASEGRAS